MPAIARRSTLLALVSALALGCADADPGADDPAEADTTLPADSLTAEEQSAFAVNPLRYPEMQDGRLDTVDMVARADQAAWHVQAMNYGPQIIAMTYAAWYTGPDPVARFAADGQPQLLDDVGNVYVGQVIPDNPRIEVESGTTAVGVLVFAGPVDQRADSLTLYINDSTPPVLTVGPFGVEHTAGSGGLRMGATPGGVGRPAGEGEPATP